MAKQSETTRDPWTLHVDELLTAEELSRWLRVPAKTIYNGGQGTDTLPRTYLDLQARKHPRWRVGAVRTWLRQREQLPATKSAAAETVVVLSQRRKKAKPAPMAQISETQKEQEQWVLDKIAHGAERWARAGVQLNQVSQ